MGKFKAITAWTRLLLGILWGGLSFLVILAPFAASHSYGVFASILYLFFSPVCHQLGDRSFHYAGYAWAVCHRCSGIYLGAFLVLVFSMGRHLALPFRLDRKWVLAALVPILLDSGLPAAGLWTNTPASRFASGALFGVMISLLLLSGIPEFIHLLFFTQPQNRSAESSGGSL